MHGCEYRVQVVSRPLASWAVQRRMRLFEDSTFRRTEDLWVTLAYCPNKMHAEGIMRAIGKADKLDRVARTLDNASRMG